MRGTLFHMLDQGSLAVILAIYFLVFFIAGSLLGAISVAVVGPRRLSAVIIPTFVSAITLLLVTNASRVTARDTAWVIAVAVGVAFVAAILQRMAMERVGPHASRRAWVFAGALAGVGLGAIIGAVGSVAFGSIAVLPFFVVFGAVIGARFGHAEGAVQDEVETGASEAPGILDG